MAHRVGPIQRGAVVAIVALLGGGCGGSRARVARTVADTTCTVVRVPGATAESATVVLTSPVDPSHAPRPSNFAERFVFAHAYESLLRVDCLGRPAGGLAKSWAALNGGAGWRVVLRADARFWTGDAVTASDVVASWRDTGRTSAAVLARRLADGATAVDDSTLDIAISGVPVTALGSPELAVFRRDARTRWPMGTGSFRVRDVGTTLPPSDTPHRPTFVLEPVGGSTAPRLTIHSSTESDARDLIDAGVELLLTESPALTTYASTRPDATSVPLAWSRTWVIVSHSGVALAPDSAASVDVIMPRTLAFRAGLARDAVRADARPAEGPFWWNDVRGCGVAPPRANGTPSRSVPSRVAYPRDEPVARALAERIVALAASTPTGGRDSAVALLAPAVAEAGARATTVGLEPNAFASALRDGSELAFVLPLDRASLSRCLDLRGAIAPLIDTRLTAVVKRDRIGLTAMWDSMVVVSSAASARDAGRP
jgi:hypothetical protein